MTTPAHTPASQASPLAFGWFGSIAWSIPMLLISALLILGKSGGTTAPQAMAAKLGVLVLFNVLFFLMLRTGKTHSFRSALFIAISVSFVLTFMPNLVETRGNIALSHGDMIEGKTPFCHMVIPMILIPAALTKTIIFPGSLIGGFASIALMLVLWIGASLALGRGWCSWVCFFGGMDEGCSRLRRKPVIQAINRKWTYLPFAILIVVVASSAATMGPTYCGWLCPFKTVTEFESVTNFKILIQTVTFLTLFVGLVIVLPILTRKRTQCALFCPMGAFQSFTNHLNIHEIAISREHCTNCGRCVSQCPTLSISNESLVKGEVLSTCTKCGRCVDACTKHAIHFHIKGTRLNASPRLARVLYLYPAYIFMTSIGGSMIIGAILRIIKLVITGSMI